MTRPKLHRRVMRLAKALMMDEMDGDTGSYWVYQDHADAMWERHTHRERHEYMRCGRILIR